MNKKGFTLIETILSFALVTVILVTLVAITVNYREKVENEQMNTMMTEFKTSVTKMVYDDIVLQDYEKLSNKVDAKPFTSITACSGDAKCARLNRSDGTYAELRVVNNTPQNTGACKGNFGIYLDYYNGSHNCVFLPDSDRNCFTHEKKASDDPANCVGNICYDCDDLENLGRMQLNTSTNKYERVFKKEVYSSCIEDFYINSNANIYNVRINFDNRTSGYKDYISITINK